MFSEAAPLSDWLAWLETLSPSEIKLGLERVQDVLVRLDLPRPPHVLLIAGTNGKGSSVAMTDALLRASGYRTGAYTSPHIFDYNERIVVDGQSASDDEIIAALGQVEAARGETELTYFEFGTLAAVVHFAAQNLDVWILEVGLGGRLDACNAIHPTASLITNVSLDHCDWLGNDVASIAVEKAGVMRDGRPTVFGHSTMPVAIANYADKIGAVLLQASRDFDHSIDSDGRWSWRGPTRVLEGLEPPGFMGAFQVGNAAAVLTLLEVSGLMERIDSRRVNDVLPDVSLMGRMQNLRIDGADWLVDVAHNPAAAEVLAGALATTATSGETVAIVGILDDKDLEGIIRPLAKCVDRWIAMTADSPRAVPASELARQISSLTDTACLMADSAEHAIEFARHRASENDRILVTGSFFTVGPVLNRLKTISRTKS